MTKPTTKSLRFWQWETLLVTMGGYALYYIIRKNLSLAMPLLGSEFGISKVQLGTFLTFHGVIYGLARFTNGILTDRNSARKVMSIGLFICACVNLAFGCSDWLAQGIEREKGFFFNNNRRFIAFESVFNFFCGNFNISFSAGRTGAAKN